MQQIERSTKPRDSISIPLATGGFGTRTPEDIVRQTLDPEGRFLPQPQQSLEIDFSRIPLPSPNPYAPAGPQPPTLAESLVPVTGNLQSYRYNLHQGNYLESAWNGANAVGDVFLVKAVLQKAGTGILKLAGKFSKSPPNLSGVAVGLEGAANGAEQAANALDKAADAAKLGDNIAPVPTGQIHHPISTRVGRALDRHPTLRGHFQPRDPRFTTRAIDEAAHRGYGLEQVAVRWRSDSGNAGLYRRRRHASLGLLARDSAGRQQRYRLMPRELGAAMVIG